MTKIKLQKTILGIPVPHPISPVGSGSAFPDTKVWYKYEKDFVLWPRKLRNGKWIWLRTVYKKFQVYSYNEIPDVKYFICCMTEDDCIVDKLKNM